MNIISLIGMVEFRIALMRHYIAMAFIAEMEFKNEMPEYIFNNLTIPLTHDRVSANIASYIERDNIQRYGIHMGQVLNAEQLNSMLESGFMAEYEPQLSEYGQTVMSDIYKTIAHGGQDGILPTEADIQVLAGDVGL